MFSEENERIIPRKRPNYAQIFLQAFFIIAALVILIGPFFSSPLLDKFFSWGDNVFLVLIFLFIVPSAAVAWFESWRVRRNWSDLAENMGFTYEPKTNKKNIMLSGRYRSHRFEITQYAERQGRSQAHYTLFTVPLNSEVTTTLTIRSKNLTDFNRDATGDAEIDRKLTVSTSSMPLLQNLLRTRRIRLGLLQLRDGSRKLQLSMDKVTLRVAVPGRIANQEYLRAVLTYLVEFAGAVERFEQVGR